MIPLERFEREGKIYFRLKRLVVLKKLKSYPSYPGTDEKILLDGKRFIEAILQTALRIEQNLKWIYFLKKNKKTWKDWHTLSKKSFDEISQKCLEENFVSKNRYNLVDRLRRARNEIAHESISNNRFIDEKKCKRILEPCFKIINKTHNQIMKIQELRKIPNKNRLFSHTKKSKKLIF